jgi:hypothetical protein
MRNASEGALVSGAKAETVRTEPTKILKADSSNPSHVMWAAEGIIVPTGPKGKAWVKKLQDAKARAAAEAERGELEEQPEE